VIKSSFLAEVVEEKVADVENPITYPNNLTLMNM
jgi:hypothetical protein